MPYGAYKGKSRVSSGPVCKLYFNHNIPPKQVRNRKYQSPQMVGHEGGLFAWFSFLVSELWYLTKLEQCLGINDVRPWNFLSTPPRPISSTRSSFQVLVRAIISLLGFERVQKCIYELASLPLGPKSMHGIARCSHIDSIGIGNMLFEANVG